MRVSNPFLYQFFSVHRKICIAWDFLRKKLPPACKNNLSVLASIWCRKGPAERSVTCKGCTARWVTPKLDLSSPSNENVSTQYHQGKLVSTTTMAFHSNAESNNALKVHTAKFVKSSSESSRLPQACTKDTTWSKGSIIVIHEQIPFVCSVTGATWCKLLPETLSSLLWRQNLEMHAWHSCLWRTRAFTWNTFTSAAGLQHAICAEFPQSESESKNTEMFIKTHVFHNESYWNIENTPWWSASALEISSLLVRSSALSEQMGTLPLPDILMTGSLIPGHLSTNQNSMEWSATWPGGVTKGPAEYIQKVLFMCLVAGILTSRAFHEVAIIKSWLSMSIRRDTHITLDLVG